MRRITFGGGNSVDNFLARRDQAVDWLMWSEEAAAVTSEYWGSIDTVLMGRKTYEVALGQDKGGATYPGKQTYVFSRSLPARSERNLTITAAGAVDFVRELKRAEGKDICLMGGGELARSLFEADLIDEIGLNIHPLLLGSGIPVFHPLTRQIDLELLECRTFRNGCVLVRYAVKH